MVQKLYSRIEIGQDDEAGLSFIGLFLSGPSSTTDEQHRHYGRLWQRLVIREHVDYSDAISYDVGAESETREVYNLTPKTTYYWKIVSTVNDEEVVTFENRLLTTGQIRMLRIDDTYNVRDLGGWATSFGSGRLRYGAIFRGARLILSGETLLTEEGKQAFLDAGVRLEVDFTHTTDASPIGESVGYFPVTGAPYMSNMQSNNNILATEAIINSLLDENKPAYFHCAGGADRTGTLAFDLEGLLGVSELDLCKDWEITTFSDQNRRRHTDSYAYKELVAAMATVNGNTTLEQEDFYLFYLHGAPEKTSVIKTIPAARLKAFICYMTGCSLEDLAHLPDE